MAAVIEMKGLTRSFGRHVALSGLDLNVRKGEILGLLGPNGAGKTTAMRLAAGLTRPTSGSVKVFEREAWTNRPVNAKRMGVLIDRPAFYDHLSARQNLGIAASMAGAKVNLDQALDRVGLLPSARRRVSTFSQGMRQRLGLAQALLTSPELLLLDEPTNGLDPEAALETIHLLRHLARASKVTILYTSHLLNEVQQLCDRVAILHAGRLLVCEEMDAALAYDLTRIEILVDGPDAVAKRLAEEDWVKSARSTGGRVIVRLDDVTVHHLSAFLIHNGYKISGIIPQQRNLQEFFLDILHPE